MFEQAMEKEENEDKEESGQVIVKKRKPKTSIMKMEKPKGSSIQFDSYIKTQVFMKMYESDLRKIKLEFNVEIVENGTEIIIVTESTNQLLMAQIMNLYKGLKCYTFHEEKLWNKIKYSE